MVPPSIIKEYLYEKFPINKVHGEEFTTNSIFTHDEKLHMSINLNTGLWQDFKGHETGNFPQLIAHVEQISYEAALKYLRSKLFDSPQLLFDISSVHVEEQKSSNDTLSDIFKTFKKFNPEKIDATRLSDRLACKFIRDRKLGAADFYIAKSGRYANRLIIPYEYDGKPFYFQARNLSVVGTKYLNPSRQVTGIKSSDILFPFKSDADYVVLVEGPLDAISLQLNGINATCTQGSRLSHQQAGEIKDKQIIFGYDNDEAGAEGIQQARSMMLSKNKKDFCIATLPEGCKDWNELHTACQSKQHFIKMFVDGLTPLDFDYEVTEALH